MRFNDDSLKYLASAASAHDARHEGSLFHKSPKDGHPSNKHFKLIANLLFYEAQSGDARRDNQSSGVMLMEKCVVNVVGIVGQPSRTFSVMFDGDGGGKHYFTASTPPECAAWMAALGRSSYHHLRSQLDNLQSELAQVNPDLYQRLQTRVITKLGHHILLPTGTSETLTGKPGRPTKSKPKIKHKSKLGSTFYGVEESENNRSTMTRNQRNPDTATHPTPAKSTFFAPLDVVRAAPSKTQTLGPARAVSATVDELRKKAMTIDRRPARNHGNTYSAPQCSTIPQPVGNHGNTYSAPQCSTIPQPAGNQGNTYSRVAATAQYSTARPQPPSNHGNTNSGVPATAQYSTVRPRPSPSDSLSADLLQFQSNSTSTEFYAEPLLISCDIDHAITDQNQNKNLIADTKLNSGRGQSSSSAVNDLLGIDFTL